MILKTFFSTCTMAACLGAASQSKPVINYLNQPPPGMQAKVFAPGIVSSALSEHSAPAFAPDGSVVLWTVMDKNYRGYLLEMTFKNGIWSTPAPPSFADSTADDYYPSFSPDGKKLFFSSRRKLPMGYPHLTDICIWEVERKQGGWGQPVPFDSTISKGHDYAHSITNDNMLYFSSANAGGTGMNMYKAKKGSKRYGKPELLPFPINSVGYEDGPYIAPDESFLVFESQRPEGINGSLDLYIAFKTKNGEWTVPENMGPKINSSSAERFAGLSPDGKYFFFGSGRNMSPGNWGFDIFRIDAQVITELKNKATTRKIIDQQLGYDIINFLDKNDAEKAFASLEKWLHLYPNSLDATVIYNSLLRRENRFAESQKLLTQIPAQWNDNYAIIMEKALTLFGLDKEEEATNLLSPLLIGEELRERYKYLSYELLKLRKFNASDVYFQKAMAIGSNGYEYLRRADQFIAIMEKDRAFEALENALAFDYITKKDLENDSGLHAMKSDPRWGALLERLK